MAEKVKLGVIGANPNRGWGPRGHLPAIVASRDVELTAVCTTRMESAEASAAKYGAKLAFDDYREMLACPDVEAVAVLLRVPSHYQVTMDALNAGKHVFTEWPLGEDHGGGRGDARLGRGPGAQAHGGPAGQGQPGHRVRQGLGGGRLRGRGHGVPRERGPWRRAELALGPELAKGCVPGRQHVDHRLPATPSTRCGSSRAISARCPR